MLSLPLLCYDSERTCRLRWINLFSHRLLGVDVNKPDFVPLTGISTVSLPLTWQARAQNAEVEILRQQQERDLAEAGLRNIQILTSKK